MFYDNKRHVQDGAGMTLPGAMAILKRPETSAI
jgi:hypothetical protein